jgi:hypothetical protein
MTSSVSGISHIISSIAGILKRKRKRKKKGEGIVYEVTCKITWRSDIPKLIDGFIKDMLCFDLLSQKFKPIIL